MLHLMSVPETVHLGANHPRIGIKTNEDVRLGLYDDLRARPAGNFLYLERGADSYPGCLFVGKAEWNAGFITKISRGFVSPDPGNGKGWVSDPARIEKLDQIGAIRTDEIVKSDGSRSIRFREPGGPTQLPDATASIAWTVSDSAGSKEVFFYAVRVLPGQVAYLQSSGYKGRRGWKITAFHADGSVEKMTPDEWRDRLAPQDFL